MSAYRAQQNRGHSFHDGTNVLPEVRAWHNYLRHSIPCADNITGALLDLIDQHLLQARDLRLSASLLYDRLMQILERAKSATPGFTAELLLVEDQARQGDEMFEPITATPRLSGSAMELFETPFAFWDSAIGMDGAEVPNVSCLGDDILLQDHADLVL